MLCDLGWNAIVSCRNDATSLEIEGIKGNKPRARGGSNDAHDLNNMQSTRRRQRRPFETAWSQRVSSISVLTVMVLYHCTCAVGIPKREVVTRVPKRHKGDLSRKWRWGSHSVHEMGGKGRGSWQATDAIVHRRHSPSLLFFSCNPLSAFEQNPSPIRARTAFSLSAEADGDHEIRTFLGMVSSPLFTEAHACHPLDYPCFGRAAS